MVLTPGETATCTFSVPYAIGTLAKAVVTVYQNGKTVLEKPINKTSTTFISVDDSHTNIIAELSQLDTLHVANYGQCEMQINLLTTSDARLVGAPVAVDVAYQHYRKIIV